MFNNTYKCPNCKAEIQWSDFSLLEILDKKDQILHWSCDSCGDNHKIEISFNVKALKSTNFFLGLEDIIASFEEKYEYHSEKWLFCRWEQISFADNVDSKLKKHIYEYLQDQKKENFLNVKRYLKKNINQ